MQPYRFFVGEEYDCLPVSLKRQIDEIGLSCRNILAQYGTKLGKEQSVAFLKEIKKLLLLILESPENITKEMVSGIGSGLISVDIEFVPECEEAIRELIDAEIKEDLAAFLNDIVNKIDGVVGEE